MMISEKSKNQEVEKTSKEDVISVLNQEVQFSLCPFESDDCLVDLVQIGEDIDQKAKGKKTIWVKCHFKSGKTYVYTGDQYADIALKSLTRSTGSDLEELSKKISKNQTHHEDKRLKESLNEEEKSQKKARNGTHKFGISLDPAVIVDEDSFKEQLKQLFEAWVDSISAMSDPYGGFADTVRTFKNGFMQAYSDQFQKIQNDEDNDIASVVQLNLESGPAVFYNTFDMNKNLGMQTWKPGIIPIAFSGKKCNKIASKPEELDQMMTSLSDLDKIEIPSDDSDEEVKFEKALEKSEEDTEK